ncbi:glucan 1,3-beta-glucosidase Bgl2 [Schizosaccharomyces japonicus yFS275]|uniref:glucan 1,3-beta-glucosidase n=1 Tax=Schizosaccharomyces japonicus (strain yFS275 / FY16936) TaxID=402676 RepID=B6K1T0_SCHJY|nr:glucan 1,3-beta-glucosidase Bgl2 [Schizosaccharomyces japonicus yFS275]EEB07111.1 glucan 1,3-beta-glucosidase Bgl2 [Schizosaccharomyces japonicus yFS275]
MKFSTIGWTGLAVAAASLLRGARAEGALNFCLGVKHADGSCKYTDDYLADFEALAPYSSVVRTYSTSDCNTLQYLMPALAQSSHNFQAIIGVWPTDDSHYALEKSALIQYLQQYGTDHVKGVTVGSEVLYRGDLTASELANRMNEVRQLLKDNGFNLPVGTADSWNLWVDGGSDPVIDASDFFMSNAFSYWQGQDTSNMTNSFLDDTMQAMGRIQARKGTSDISFYVGETGWPTGGPSYGSAVASTDVAAKFYKEALCGIRSWGVDIFYFEAFDEPWKGTDSGVEPYFGAMDSNRNLKFDLSC